MYKRYIKFTQDANKFIHIINNIKTITYNRQTLKYINNMNTIKYETIMKLKIVTSKVTDSKMIQIKNWA